MKKFLLSSPLWLIVSLLLYLVGAAFIGSGEEPVLFGWDYHTLYMSAIILFFISGFIGYVIKEEWGAIVGGHALLGIVLCFVTGEKDIWATVFFWLSVGAAILFVYLDEKERKNSKRK